MVVGLLAHSLTAESLLDPSKISQTADYRLVTDTEKGVWDGKQASGVCALLSASNTFAAINPLITQAESWIGPSATAGMYFNSGNVGIGTTSPGAKLEVYTPSGDFGEGLRLTHVFGTVNQTNGVSFLSSAGIEFGRIEQGTDSAGMGGRLMLSTRPAAGGSIQERFRITESGNVGIGTTGPTSYLHLKAGTATAATAPFKLTPTGAVLLTTPELGAFEVDLTNLYYTRVSAREIIPTVITKTDTEDPTGAEGILSINTYDNNVKIFADGAWRTLATW